MLSYNRRVRLTSATDPRSVALRHFADSLSPLPWLKKHFPAGASLVDVGAGAGFVGLCLKMAWPECRVTLLESSRRKHAFLDWMVSLLGLGDARALWGRAEEKKTLSPGAEYDVAVERALAPLSVALEWCSPWVKPEGCFLAFQGRRASAPVGPDLARSGFEWMEETVYQIPPIQFAGQLFIFRKRGRTCI